MIKPATILNSLPKKINTFPIKEAAIPKDIKTAEKPSEKTIVLNRTTLLFFSISSNFLPVIYEIYPGIIGKTHGDKKLIKPAPIAMNDFRIINKMVMLLLSYDY